MVTEGRQGFASSLDEEENAGAVRIVVCDDSLRPGSFDSRLNCLLRPGAGATDSDASLRMTEFSVLLRLEGMRAEDGVACGLRLWRVEGEMQVLRPFDAHLAAFGACSG